MGTVTYETRAEADQNLHPKGQVLGEMKGHASDLIDTGSFPLLEKAWSSRQREEPSSEIITKLLCDLSKPLQSLSFFLI